uniref:Distal membrane-arm assembly complex protein 1-like domain-containing protein n=1 Tax=Salarias fasciatus TaxID=181472 RepID=A0A672J3L4_SALFA
TAAMYEESAAPPAELLKTCWSCRVISGGGLVLAGAYVYSAATKVMRRGGPASMGLVAQITFAASLAAWGIVILTDPVGKSHRVGEDPKT